LSLNLGVIDAVVKSGAIVTPKTLIEMKLMSTFEGKIPKVKILAGGEITKKISVENCIVSKEAKAKIEKAGGSVKL
jgi:large subunit ribosomal protein L15